MAIKSKFIIFDTLNTFQGVNGINKQTTATNGYYGNVPEGAVVFIKNTGQIWFNGTYYGIATNQTYATQSWVISQGYTKNTGTVTSIAAGAGLTGGTITTSGTIKANLVHETKASFATSETPSNRVTGKSYPVSLDSNGKLMVYVPWSDNNTTSFTITANAIDGLWDITGTNGTNAVTYAVGAYGSQQSKASFDTSSTAPTRSDRLNYNGYFYATKLFSGGVEVLTSHQSLANYYTKTESDNKYVYKSGDTITGNLTVNGNTTLNKYITINPYNSDYGSNPVALYWNDVKHTIVGNIKLDGTNSTAVDFLHSGNSSSAASSAVQLSFGETSKLATINGVDVKVSLPAASTIDADRVDSYHINDESPYQYTLYTSTYYNTSTRYCTIQLEKSYFNKLLIRLLYRNSNDEYARIVIKQHISSVIEVSSNLTQYVLNIYYDQSENKIVLLFPAPNNSVVSDSNIRVALQYNSLYITPYNGIASAYWTVGKYASNLLTAVSLGIQHVVIGNRIIKGSMIPYTPNTYDLGSSTYIWNYLYANNLSDGTNSLTVANIKSTYDWYQTMTTGNTDGTINKWKEIESFVNGISDTSTLNGILQNYFCYRGTYSSTNIASSTPTQAELSDTSKLNGMYRVQYSTASGTLLNFVGEGSTRYVQFYTTYNSGMLWRQSTDANYNSWRTILDSTNYTSYINIANFPGLNKVGTVTSVATSDGIKGGTITSSGTISLNLVHNTKTTYDATETAANRASNRSYPVSLDKSGHPMVYVPWENTHQSLSGYLPLSGGTLSLGSVNSFIIKKEDNTNTLSLIYFQGSNAANSSTKIGYGHLGFNGENTPVFRNTSGSTYNLLHSGNTYINSSTITINGTNITPLTSHQSLSNYYTKTESDNRYVNVTGDWMGGRLAIKRTLATEEAKTSPAEQPLLIEAPSTPSGGWTTEQKASWKIAPGIGFHWPLVTFASIIYNGNFRFINSTYNGYVGIQASNINGTNIAASNQLSVTRNSNTITIASETTSWAHIKSTSYPFYFNQSAHFNGSVVPYTTDTYTLGNTTKYWKNIYTNALNIGNSENDNILTVTGKGYFGSTLTASSFIKSGGTSSQFLKADGSIDNTVYATKAQLDNLALISGSGTVTSVGLTNGGGISISGSPITTSGNITISNAGVRSVSINGDYLRVNTAGTNADLTIPYATDATNLRLIPNSTENYQDSAIGKSYCITGYRLTGSNTLTASTGDGYLLAFNYGNNYVTQIAIDLDPTYKLAIRNWKNGTGWNDWKNILTNNNAYISNGTITIDGTSITPVTTSNITNYYWANVKISESSKSNTSPTFKNSFFLNNAGTAQAGYVGVGATSNDTIYLMAYSGNQLQLGANSSVAATINTSGNVGIGTTSPSYKLDVNGDTRSTAFFINGANDARISGRGNISNTGEEKDLWIYQNKNTLRTVIYDARYIHLYSKVRIGTNYSTTTTPEYALEVSGSVSATDFTATSDIRLKRDIQQISDHIYSFRFKDSDKLHYGFIAQELEKEHPDLVGEGEYKTVNYNSALSLYVAELENRVKMLENEINNLKNK